MNPFSVELEMHLKEKNIRAHSLAQFCGIERSNMYKIITGKRKPSSEEVVERIAEYLELRPNERRTMLEAYYETVLGRENYYRRKCVQEFLSAFHSHTFEYAEHMMHDYMHVAVDESQLAAHQGKIISGRELYRMIQGLLHVEAKNLWGGVQSGRIKAFIQPDHDMVMEMLLLAGEKQKELSIEHIFCIHNSCEMGADKRDYNLDILAKLIPLFAKSQCEYHPYYYHDNIRSRKTGFNLMSSMLLTTKYALLFSSEENYGMLLSDPDSVQTFHHIFESLKQDAKCLALRVTSLEEQLLNYQEINYEGDGIGFQRDACLVPFLSPDLLQKYVKQELLLDSSILVDVIKHIQNTEQTLRNMQGKYLFTEDGLHAFLQTGKMSEIPDKIYEPFEWQDRVELLKRMIPFVQHGQYRMLKPNSPLGTCEISIYIAYRTGYLLFPDANRDHIYIRLQEAALLNAFRDYLENLEEKYFYTNKEAVEIITAMMSKE